MYIKPTKGCKDLYSINEEMYEEVLLYPQNDEVPCPWDAGIIIDGDTIILEGGVGPSGSNGATCICKVPIQYFSKYYKLEAPDEYADELKAAGWLKA